VEKREASSMQSVVSLQIPIRNRKEGERTQKAKIKLQTQIPEEVILPSTRQILQEGGKMTIQN